VTAPVRSLRRWLVVILLALILVIGGAVVFLRVGLEGGALARRLMDVMNESMSGRLEIREINWPVSALPKVVTGGWIPLVARDVDIRDRDGKHVLHVEELAFELDIHALLLRGNFTFRRVVFSDGWVKLEEIPEPYPLHQADKTVFSLFAAFYSTARPTFSAGLYADSAPVFDLQDVTLRDIDLELRSGVTETRAADGSVRRSHGVVLDMKGLDGAGLLYMDPSDPLAPKLYMSVASEQAPLRADSATLTAADDFVFEFTELTVHRFAQLPTKWPDDVVANDLELDLSGTTDTGARLRLAGALEGYWDSPYGGTYALTLTVDNAGILAGQQILTGLGGSDLRIEAAATGPLLAPNLRADLFDLVYQLPLAADEPPLELTLESARVTFDMATETGALERARAKVAQAPEEGRVDVSASLTLDPFYLDLSATIDAPIDLRRWLPPVVSEVFGSRTHGSFRLSGDSSLVAQLTELDLHVGALHLDGGPIITENEFEKVVLRGVRGRAGASTVVVDGWWLPEQETFDLQLDLDSPDLATWLRRAGLAPLATRASGRRLALSGSLDAPRASGQVALRGVQVVDDVAATFRYADDALTIDRAVSRSLGDLQARGTVALGVRPRARGVRVRGSRLDLGRLAARLDRPGVVAGFGDVDASLSGPLDRDARIEASLVASDLQVLGEPLARLHACYNLAASDPRCAGAETFAGPAVQRCEATAGAGGQCALVSARRAEGGAASIVAHADAAGRLGGRVSLAELPIAAFARSAATTPPSAGGAAALELDLGGTLAAPTASGTISALRAWLLSAYLGDEALALRVAGSDDPVAECAADRPPPTTTATGRIALCGELQDGRVAVAAVLGTAGTMPLDLRVDLRRLELDPFGDLAALTGMASPPRAWASGTVRVRTELRRDDAPLDVRLDLPELAVLLPRVDGDGRQAPVVMAAAAPVAVTFDGTTLRLVEPLRLQTPAGLVTVTGTATPAALALRVDGTLGLGDLQPLLGARIDEATGTVRVLGSIDGPLAAPALSATVELTGLAVRPAGQDTRFSIDRARLTLSPERGLSLGVITLDVEDPSSGERASLTVSGGLRLAGLRPTDWGVIVDGELAGALLPVLAPAQVSQASGVAQVSLVVETAADGEPAWFGALAFDPARPFTVLPRALRRELGITGGRVSVSKDGGVRFEDLQATFDDEGRITDLDGTVTLDGLSPSGCDLALSADGLPLRIPRTLDLVLSAEQLRVTWRDDDPDHPGLRVAGRVELVQGVFKKNFGLDEFLRPSDDGGGGGGSPWDESPLLGNAALAIDIDARSFQVVNNLADMELAGEVALRGTPRDPRLDGEILVQRGTFKLPGMRPRFTRTRGSVAFSQFGQFPAATLDVASEADYRDPTGQDHLITLLLQGPLDRLRWDLSTSTGYDKTETLALIFGAKVREAPNQAVDPLDSDQTRVDPSTNPTQGAADQILKDVAGDFISLLVADPLEAVDILDVARLEVGTGSIGFHGERRLVSNTNVIGDYEQTVRGRTVNVRVEIKSTVGATVQFGWLDKQYDDPAEEDVRDLEGKVVYRYRWFVP
jgi:hypothetical protein